MNHAPNGLRLAGLLLTGTLLLGGCSEKKKFTAGTPPVAKPEIVTIELGARAASTAASLTDNDLTTYFMAPTDASGEVEVTVPCSAGQIVAYTLVSSGEVYQNPESGAIEPLYDPASWRVEGSNDGVTWTVVDARSDERFVARFHNHLYRLAAPAAYTQYRFVLQSNGGDHVSLSDILFHTEDPYASWGAFEAPEVSFRDQARDRGARLYDLLVQDKEAFLQWHAREVCTLLYFNDGDERFPVNTIEYYLEPMPGQVSYKAGGSPKVEIHYSTDWIEKSAGESLLKLNLETRGVLFHEMTHAFQLEPKGIPGYGAGEVFWSVIEGLADGVRTQAGYHNYATRDRNGSVMSGYQTTGFFCYWLTRTQDADAIRKINASMREVDPWSWSGGLQWFLGPEVDETSLWAVYRDDARNYQDDDPNYHM